MKSHISVPHPGIFTVRLTVTDTVGLQASTTKEMVSATFVEGIIRGSFTFTAEDSPYAVKDNLQMGGDSDIDLIRFAPGSSVIQADSGANIGVAGTVLIDGTAEQEVNIDGVAMRAPAIDASYVTFENAPLTGLRAGNHMRLVNASILEGRTLESLTDSVIQGEQVNIACDSCVFERNVLPSLVLSMGPFTGRALTLRNNRFMPSAVIDMDILCDAAPPTILFEKNSFLMEKQGALHFRTSGCDESSIPMEHNFWGTTNSESIEYIIFDSQDSLGVSFRADFDPPLPTADPLTP